VENVGGGCRETVSRSSDSMAPENAAPDVDPVKVCTRRTRHAEDGEDAEAIGGVHGEPQDGQDGLGANALGPR